MKLSVLRTLCGRDVPSNMEPHYLEYDDHRTLTVSLYLEVPFDPLGRAMVIK
jgi:hypothetical protein